MRDPYEILVRWYLRFNGYLGVENFVIHEPDEHGVPAGGEFDVIGVRFPYSREEVSLFGMDPKIVSNDLVLEDAQVKQQHLIDFVIAEVKTGDPTLNKVWRTPDKDGKRVKRLQYLLRWLGMDDNEKVLKRAAEQLQAEKRVWSGAYSVRLVFFGHRTSDQAIPRGVPQITFAQIAKFIVTCRTPCWKEYKMGVRSSHPQWDPLIKEIWKLGDPDRPVSEGDRVADILRLLEVDSNDSS